MPAKDVPNDENAAYEQVKSGMAKDGIEAFPPTPFTDSNGVALTQKTADKLGVTKISDLKDKASQLTLVRLAGVPHAAGLPARPRAGLRAEVQEVHVRRPRQRHEVLKSGQADVSIVFTTDPQIKRDNEVLLQDDKGMFPPYNSTFLMKKSMADAAGPDVAVTVDAVNKDLTADVMQELNARVDLDKDTPEQAAQAYLKQFKLIPS